MSLAKLNQLKYARAMRGRGRGGARTPARKRAPDGIEKVKRDRFQMGYKFGDFVKRIETNSVFTYARYSAENIMQNRSRALYSFTNIVDSGNDSYLFHYPIFSLDGTWKNQTRATDFDSVLGATSIKFLPHDPIMRSFQKYPDIFQRLVNALNSKRLVVIAPEYVREEVNILQWTEFIPFVSLEKLEEDVMERMNGPRTLFLLLSIPGSKVEFLDVIDRLHPLLKGNHWLIDGGSTFDNFASPEHRREEYMTKMRSQWEQFYRSNLMAPKPSRGLEALLGPQRRNVVV